MNIIQCERSVVISKKILTQKHNSKYIIVFPESNADCCRCEERRDEAICSYMCELRDCYASPAKTLLSRDAKCSAVER